MQIASKIEVCSNSDKDSFENVQDVNTTSKEPSRFVETLQHYKKVVFTQSSCSCYIDIVTRGLRCVDNNFADRNFVESHFMAMNFVNKKFVNNYFNVDINW